MRLLLPAVLALSLAVCPGSVSAQPEEVPTSRTAIKQSFAPVVRKVTPAVVNIYTRKVVHQQASPLFNDPFFQQFFGPGFPMMGPEQDQVQNSLGSGVILSGNGTVVTNHHVVAGADEVTVVLYDGREFEATVVGSDERTDLAVLKLKGLGNEVLPTLPLGDSDALEVGDLVLAVGNPFGVGQTVTSGIVSALARTNVGISGYSAFIQTDAAINPGNSGGALVDLNGQLIGINTAIFSKSGGSIGIGFAIPVSLVKNVATAITTTGKVARPWLGASGQAITADLALALGLSRPSGVVVTNIHANSPAAAAGLRNGDVITALNGFAVNDPEAMRFRLATLPLDQTVTISVLRDGKPQDLRVSLTTPPETPARNPTEISGKYPLSGATLVNINPALIDELGFTGAEFGVMVFRIARGSFAHRLGLAPGDVLIKINETAIERVNQVLPALKDAQRGWTITILRDGERQTVQVGR